MCNNAKIKYSRVPQKFLSFFSDPTDRKISGCPKARKSHILAGKSFPLSFPINVNVYLEHSEQIYQTRLQLTKRKTTQGWGIYLEIT